MTRDEKIIRNKVGVLELAKQLGSVSHTCRIMGFSRGMGLHNDQGSSDQLAIGVSRR